MLDTVSVDALRGLGWLLTPRSIFKSDLASDHIGMLVDGAQPNDLGSTTNRLRATARQHEKRSRHNPVPTASPMACELLANLSRRTRQYV
jgi:hypothetical protein